MTGLRPGGRLVLSGIDPTTPFTFPRSAHVPLRTEVILSTHNGLQYLQQALDLAAAGKVTPMVETYSKEQVTTAVDRVANGEARFRAVVTF